MPPTDSALDTPRLLPSDAADLAANRAGRMSDRQRGALAATMALHRELYRLSSTLVPAETEALMRSAHEEAAAGAVAACDAIVEFVQTTPEGARNTYVARALATGAPLPMWSVVPPGARRLYVLPRSGLVVGAEPPDARALAAYRDLILQLQGISAADLAMLARGSIPPSCVAMLRAGRNEGAFAFLAFGAAILGAMLALLGMAPSVAASPVPLIVGGLVTVVAGGAIGAWMLARRARIATRVRAEPRDGLLATRTVSSERLDPQREYSERQTMRALQIGVGAPHGLHWFRADHLEIVGAFVHGFPHRIWFTQPGGTAIVVEPLVARM